MNHRHEIRPDLAQGIDRKVLATLRARFLQLSQGRLWRAREGLSSRQQRVLTLLPLLLHINHPRLPGYVSGTTPAGIAGFEPDLGALVEAQRLTRAFTYRPQRDDAPRPLLGLYLIGSLGTLAQAEQSDMDVWVCHRADLDGDALAELRRKCQALEDWAATQGADAHLFLIDSAGFARGERTGTLSSDDCGHTQHYLLLDEFYRTAIWLAGQTPVWWLVPVYEEDRYQAYVQALLDKRFIHPHEHFDLGHLARIPPKEFVGAGLWQLYKGLESPYKSLLKLLLTEAYASDHPALRCLSLDFKAAVHANRLDLDELDPYVMVYRRIEHYLLRRGETRRLELVRRSLYFKVNQKLGSAEQGRSGWQRSLLRRLTAQWGWDERTLRLLDSRSQWKVGQVLQSRRELVMELNHAYRFLARYARDSTADSHAEQRDLDVLGRRLYAAFERRAGKIEVINPGIAPDLAEDTLTLVHSPDRQAPDSHHWTLYPGNLAVHAWPAATPIKRNHELVELLTWAHRNGVIDSSTRLTLHPGINDLNERALFDILDCLRQHLPLPLPAISDNDLLRPSVANEVLLLVNVGSDPLHADRASRIPVTSPCIDAPSNAGALEQWVLSLDQLTLNSWNEVLVQRYDGEGALARCLRGLHEGRDRNRRRPRLKVRCFGHLDAKAIERRIEVLFDNLGIGQRQLL
nr:class I adenylate cyclase [uncultured Pseudomonas sp.]